MGCCSSKGVVAQSMVAGDGTQTGLFVPLTDMVSLAEVTEVEVVSEVTAVTGPFSVQPAVKYSNSRDTAASGSHATFGTAQTATGTSFSQFTSLPGSPRRFGQFGYEVRNTDTGGLVNRATTVLRLRFRKV
jgi:hypothetical protein